MGDPPNILLIMTDQHRWDALSAVSDWLSTPHLDRIAAEGMRANRAYTNSPVCVPARVSLATGRYPHNTGVWENGRYDLPGDAPTWMRSVQDAGYATSVFGKTHLHAQVGDLRDRVDLVRSWGLDHVDEIAGPRASTKTSSHLTDLWDQQGVREAYVRDVQSRVENEPWAVRPSPLPLELYPDSYVGRQAARWLEDRSDPQPWMCWVSFSGPHEPWDCPEPYASRFDPAAMPPPLVAREDAREDRHTGLLDKMADLQIPPEDVARMRADYAGKLALIDDQVGELLRVVEERGELDNTVIAFVSDHGEMNGDFGLIYKQNFLDPSARIPFLLRAPGVSPGTVLDDPVELMDIGATLVDLAGGEPVEGSHARSLMPRLTGETERHRRSATCEFNSESMIVTPQWKMAVNRLAATYLLFDLENDPHETTNLAGAPAHHATQTQLRNLMLRRLHRTLR